MLTKVFDHFTNYQDLIGTLLSKECQILNTGYNSTKMPHYYCNCDLERKNPMCKTCIDTCHFDHKSKIPLKEIIGEVICHCGLNYHKVTLSDETKSNNYTPCFFSDWSITSKIEVYYSYKKCYICMFCKNMCVNFQKSITLNQGGEFKKKKIKPNKKKHDCNCNDDNHKSNKNIFEKLNEFQEFNKFNFENLTLIHLINLLFKSEGSYTNLKLNLISNPQSDFYNGLKNLFKLSEKVKLYNYYSDLIKNQFDFEFINLIVQKSINFSSYNDWTLKNYIVAVYRKIVFLNDFSTCPFFTIGDISNMNPFLRLMLINNVIEDTQIRNKYLGFNSDKPFIDSIFTMQFSLINIADKNIQIYSIIKNLCSIVKIFSKYNLFSQANILNFCKLNEELIRTFAENRKSLFLSKKDNKSNMIYAFLGKNLIIN